LLTLNGTNSGCMTSSSRASISARLGTRPSAQDLRSWGRIAGCALLCQWARVQVPHVAAVR
jgi:hypothetical protein